MIWQTIVCILAACGLVLVIWIFLGARLLRWKPRDGQLLLLWLASGDTQALHRSYEALLWRRESGLAPQQLLICNAGLSAEALEAARIIAQADPRVQFMEEPSEILQERSNGRGTDHSTGHCECRGVSK